MAKKNSAATAWTKAVEDRLAREPDVLSWRNNTGATKIKGAWVAFGEKGSGDVLAVVGPHGRFLSVECKTGRASATPAQRAWIEKVRAAGGVAGVARSLADLEELLEEARRPL